MWCVLMRVFVVGVVVWPRSRKGEREKLSKNKMRELSFSLFCLKLFSLTFSPNLSS